MNQPQHISRRFDNFNDEQIATNRLRLKGHIHVVLLLALQGIPFRGHDEKSSSSNRGNFLEFLNVLSMYNDELSKAIAKAPKNAKYTSHDIQKQILHVLSMRVKNVIREEIGVAKYCIIVDEARDESKREQVSIVLRFVDTNGFIQERFFGLIHVFDTTTLTLKDAIYSSLAHYNLDVQNIRGQGYDGASNMRGEFNGLQVLIIKDCRSAYYVHCFTHRLQLALVATSKNVTLIHQFFDRLTFIINIVGSSCKRNDELNNAHTDDIAHLIVINELKIGRGLNQIDEVKPVLVKTISPLNIIIRVEDICKLVEKFYVKDFTRDEKEQLEMQLKHYEYNIVKGPNYNNLTTISELCQWNCCIRQCSEKGFSAICNHIESKL
ncbi:zinc finger MYM-type protein 1-like [Zingiber officinale]|uniref:zinc finger MYM-type protein 1-like n=1 Tax=Zingiber officinale TaxID=94328 RepID=UPI001C4D5A36|nr:zinc finger MYM-type protein 1-like [Zingiber officinale]